MLLGQEGEAFFLREAFEYEAVESIENVSNRSRPASNIDDDEAVTGR